MPAERLTMRKIREVFRLKLDCEPSNRKIAAAENNFTINPTASTETDMIFII